MDAFDAIHNRRSIRRYTDEPVSPVLLDELVLTAAQAPVTPVRGEQPWVLCAIDGRARLAAYGARARQYAREYLPPGRPWTWPDRPGFEVFWDALLLLICARQGNPETPWYCCRAAQNLLLAAHARGLGSCWVGTPMPWLTSPGGAAELGLLGLPAGYEPQAAILLGHTAEQPVGQPKARPGVMWL